jgi:hypothetical protein
MEMNWNFAWPGVVLDWRKIAEHLPTLQPHGLGRHCHLLEDDGLTGTNPVVPARNFGNLVELAENAVFREPYSMEWIKSREPLQD